MTFYQELQLNQAGSKNLLKKSETLKEKLYHMWVYLVKIAATMAFCFFFVSIFSILFGNENSIVGVVVLLCLMVFRNADLGIHTGQSTMLLDLFFYALFLLVPASVSDNWTYDFEASVAMRGTETDLRTTQSCFLLYVFFVVLAVLLLAVLLRDVMQNAQWARASTFFALFSFGVLNAVDRGNIGL